MDGKCQSNQIILILGRLKNFIYVALLLATLIFVYDNFKEYHTGATFISISPEPIDKRDIPTTTLCFISKKPMKYGRDFTIQAQNPIDAAHTFSKFVTLTEGENEYKWVDENRTLLLNQWAVTQSSLFKRSCVAINVLMKGRLDSWRLHFGTFIISISERFQKEYIRASVVYITSERNSYGAVIDDWMDGEVQPFTLFRGGINKIRINSIKRFDYLEGACSKESFFQCVASKLIKAKACQENGEICCGLTLPKSTPFTTYPICQKLQTARNCYKHFKSVAYPQCIISKPCSVQEYGIREDEYFSAKDSYSLKNLIDTWFNPDRVDTNLTVDGHQHRYMVNIGFENSRGREQGIHQRGYQKEVHTEYLAWSLFAIVGNVGGYLGLCVGFSFIGFFDWIIDTIPTFGTTLTKLLNSSGK